MGVNVLIEKPPIVATHVGGFSKETELVTTTRYFKEAETYIRPGVLGEYQINFLDSIKHRKPTLGCLVAPFGYGKTSAAIDLWDQAQKEGFLAIPPFSCNSIAEMGAAIASGVEIQLGEKDRNFAKEANQAYKKYLESSADRLAKHDVQEFKFDYEAALQSIQDKIEKGYLQLEASGIHLLSFIDEIVEIVTAAGYEGLLIIVDEFQQFLGTINKTTLSNFRTLVWGIKTRKEIPLGFLITMDPDTEQNLNERAGDIVHRIKEDGFYFPFSSIYDRNFPKKLWDRYSKVFSFEKENKIVDGSTLEAIGQICERGDLSNGPRTVINIFQQIAHHSNNGNKSYSPINLIDDFLLGSIKFDGDKNRIASLLTELVNYDYIRLVPERVLVLKLFAAFPRGCPKSVAEEYGLSATYDQLSDELRGEILTQLPDGMALIDLQKVGKPQNKLNIILKKYWMQITEDEIISERIPLLFAKFALEPLFPEYTHVLNGWKSETKDFQLTTEGGYLKIFEGTFFDKFPCRKIAVQVCESEDQAVEFKKKDNIHISIIFLLKRSKVGNKWSTYYKDQRTLVLSIPYQKPFSIRLPRDIRWIEDFLNPVKLSIGVLVSLIDYIDQQVPLIDGISELELARIEDNQEKLLNHLFVMLYDSELFSGTNKKIISRGRQSFKDTIYEILKLEFPEYQTLISSTQWENYISRYKEILRSIPLSQRRGVETLSSKKDAIALKFGLKKHAGFASEAKQYGDLLSLEKWSGDFGSLRFLIHPSEEALYNYIAKEEPVSKTKAKNWFLGNGYVLSEFEHVLDIMTLRGVIERNKQILNISRTLPRSELITMVDELINESQIYIEYGSDEMVLESQKTLGDLRKLLSELNDDANEANSAQITIIQIQSDIKNFREEFLSHLVAQKSTLRRSLHKFREIFQEEFPVLASELKINNHINGIQRILEKKNTSILREIDLRIEKLSDTNIRLDISIDNQAEFLEVVKNEVGSIQEFNDFLLNLELINESNNLHKEWIETANILERISDYITIASEITETSALRAKLDRIIDEASERLAVDGFKEYENIIRSIEPAVTELLSELEIAIKLSNVSSNQAHDIVTSDDISAEILNLLSSGKQHTIRKISEKLSIPEDDILQTLLSLESRGEIKISIQKVKM